MADYNMYKEKKEKKVQVRQLGDELKDINKNRIGKGQIE